MKDPRPRAFTLIELLVVVTIIVVLLAMLTPALDKAIYRAELVTCAARESAGSIGTLTYTAENKRGYPYRSGAQDANNWLPMYLCTGDYDDRPRIFSAMRPQALLDPFSGKINLESASLRPVVYANYCMWFGWRYFPSGNNGKDKQRERGMYKRGDRFTWTDTSDPAHPLVRAYNLLISDDDTIRQTTSLGSHPDREPAGMVFAMAQDDVAAAVFWASQGQTLTVSYWRNQTAHRGLYDTNFCYDDGSVRMFDNVRFSDAGTSTEERMDYVPEGFIQNADFNAGFGRQIPRQ